MRSSGRRSRWSWLRATACLLALLLLGEASDTLDVGRVELDARTRELTALDSVHARLAAITDVPTSAQATRDGLRGMRHALSPTFGDLREDAGAPTTELEHRIASALAQLDDGGALLDADRSEFVLSALIPIASALDETRAALGEAAR